MSKNNIPFLDSLINEQKHARAVLRAITGIPPLVAHRILLTVAEHLRESWAQSASPAPERQTHVVPDQQANQPAYAPGATNPIPF